MNDNNFNNGTGSITGNYGYTFTLPFLGGSSVTNVQISDGTGLVYGYGGIQQQQGSTGKSTRKRIGPKLYFSYVKSKLNKTQVKKLKSRLQKLQALVKNAEEVGQKALYEELSRMLVVAVRESEAAACGYDVFLNKTDIYKYMSNVSESDSDTQNPVRFKRLDEFPRSIPTKVKKKLKAVQSKGIFDEYWILYLDYSGENIKSNKEKIREKDPILFGKFSYDDQRMYFIADWIDEYCDLTLSKFVDTLKADNEEYETSKIEEITPEYLERIKSEMKEREDRLNNTNPSNFRSHMLDEDEDAELRRLIEENAELKRQIDEKFKTREEDRAEWRKEANEELQQIVQEKDEELTKKPWYKKLFGL